MEPNGDNSGKGVRRPWWRFLWTPGDGALVFRLASWKILLVLVVGSSGYLAKVHSDKAEADARWQAYQAETDDQDMVRLLQKKTGKLNAANRRVEAFVRKAQSSVLILATQPRGRELKRALYRSLLAMTKNELSDWRGVASDWDDTDWQLDLNSLPPEIGRYCSVESQYAHRFVELYVALDRSFEKSDLRAWDAFLAGVTDLGANNAKSLKQIKWSVPAK